MWELAVDPGVFSIKFRLWKKAANKTKAVEETELHKVHSQCTLEISQKQCRLKCPSRDLGPYFEQRYYVMAIWRMQNLNWDADLKFFFENFGVMWSSQSHDTS